MCAGGAQPVDAAQVFSLVLVLLSSSFSLFIFGIISCASFFLLLFLAVLLMIFFYFFLVLVRLRSDYFQELRAAFIQRSESLTFQSKKSGSDITVGLRWCFGEDRHHPLTRYVVPHPTSNLLAAS